MKLSKCRDTSWCASKIIELLTKRNETIAVSESCTGGLLGALFTTVPGASKVFHGGIIAYDNKIKEKFLGVTKQILKIHGAVSSECAEKMAKAVRREFDSDWGISVTGIAGPGGGTKEKPVGTVYISIIGKNINKTVKKKFSGRRNEIRIETAAAILILFYRILTLHSRA